jgi:hypothetical protein
MALYSVSAMTPGLEHCFKNIKPEPRIAENLWPHGRRWRSS